MSALLDSNPEMDRTTLCQALASTFPTIRPNALKLAVKRCHTKLCEQRANSELIPLKGECAALFHECSVSLGVALQDIPGKGRGVVAAKDLRRGQLLMFEEALITSHSPNVLFPEGEISAEFERALQAMHTLQVARAPKPGLDLTDTRTESRKRDAEMFWTNAMPTEDGCSAVFPIVARFNHSCVPNALFHWSIELKKECVVVVQDIQAGQEICVHYRENDMFCSRAERQHMLQQGFGFECHCIACDSPRFVQSDSNRSEIRRLQQQLSSYKDDEERHDEALDEECYHRALGNVKTMMELAQQEGLDNQNFWGRGAKCLR